MILFVTEIDLSIDNGPGINEREFVLAAHRRYPGRLTCVAPEPARPLNLDDAEIAYVSGGTGGALEYARFLCGAYRKIRSIQRRRPVDALVFRLGGTPILPFIFSRQHRQTIILKKLALYAIFGEKSTRAAWKNRLSRLLLPMYRSVVRSAIVADTESIPYVDWLNETFGIPTERLVVVRNGANTELFVPGSQVMAPELDSTPPSYVLGYVGAMSRLRHVDRLVRVVAKLHPVVDVSLVLVGDGSERGLLSELAQREGVEDRVTLVGSIAYEEVPRYMQGFDAGIDLTAVEMNIRGRTVLSSYSQKIPQYLACGVPVVAWRCVDTEYLERYDVGRLASFGDEDELATAISELASLDPSSRKRMSQQARVLAEAQFSSDRLVDRRMSLWQDLLTGNPAEP